MDPMGHWCQATPPSVSLPQSSWLPPPRGLIHKGDGNFRNSAGTDQSGIHQPMIYDDLCIIMIHYDSIRSG